MTRQSTRDDFSQGVRDVLAHRAGFRCSKPDCRAPTAGPSSDDGKHGSIGIAAHITAAAPGGPRFDPALSSEQRGSASNGLWLCDNHAREVDKDSARYTTETLHAWKVHAEEEARAMLGRPLSGAGLDVAIDLALQRDLNEGLVVVGETNLPEGTKLMGSLSYEGTAPYSGHDKCRVTGRRFLLGPFTRSGQPLPQQWYQVEVYSYFNGPWQQPAHVLELVGRDGKKLVGAFARPLDPDLDDTDYAVQARFECPAPQLRSEDPLTDDEIRAAINMLQESTLAVEGHDEPRSSESVGDVVRRFMSTPKLREHEGWKTSVVAQGVVDVTFSFWSGDRIALAHWQVMPRSKEIRYRNQYAKYMSWSPNY